MPIIWTTQKKWFLEKQNISKLKQKEIEGLNRPITSTEIENGIKILSANKIQGPDGFTGEFYQNYREKLTPRWQEYTEVYEKDLHEQDNHDGVITHLEPDILECEVKWALESITMNKASGGDGLPGELFQILKDDAVKVLPSLCQQIWKTQQWPKDWKGQFLFQSQIKAMPKTAQTTAQLHSSHTLVK